MQASTHFSGKQRFILSFHSSQCISLLPPVKNNNFSRLDLLNSVINLLKTSNEIIIKSRHFARIIPTRIEEWLDSAREPKTTAWQKLQLNESEIQIKPRTKLKNKT